MLVCDLSPSPRVMLQPHTADTVGFLSMRHDAQISLLAELEEGWCWVTPDLWRSRPLLPVLTHACLLPVLPWRAKLSPWTEPLKQCPPSFCILDASHPSLDFFCSAVTDQLPGSKANWPLDHHAASLLIPLPHGAGGAPLPQYFPAKSQQWTNTKGL